MKATFGFRLSHGSFNCDLKKTLVPGTGSPEASITTLGRTWERSEQS